MIICGIDEAGRGPIAGPVVVACTLFEEKYMNSDVKDSKVLSDKKRRKFFKIITENCLDYSISVIDNEIIDEINILEAVMMGAGNCISKLSTKFDKLLIDGNYFKLKNNDHLKFNYETVIQGDKKILSISAASILAKVTRDDIMLNYNNEIPFYGFDKNKGYGTRDHFASIKKFGLSKIHRKTFLKLYL